MITDKKLLAETKRKHDLHVLLLQETRKINKAQALVQAYAEGQGGLTALMQTAPALRPEPQK